MNYGSRLQDRPRNTDSGPSNSPTQKKINILLVDDRADKLLALETALSSLNQNVVKVSSGADALRALLQEDFAVILLDVSMPGMDGFQTAALIRQRARTEHTPIIFVTSINTSETHVTQGYSLGAVDYVFSPIEPEILRAKVGVFIDLFRKTEQIKEQAELLQLAAEKKVSSLESRLQNLLNRLNVGVFKAKSNGEIIESNRAFSRLFECGPATNGEELNVKHFCPDLDLSSHSSEVRDIQWTCADGETRWFAVSLSSFPDNEHCIEGMVEDITDRKRNEELLRDLNDTLEKRVIERSEALRQSQEHLRRSERLASLGTLAAGIAHEINNPLNSILMGSEYARKHIDKLDVVQKTLEIISDNTKRCGRIIKGVLQFAKNHKTAKAKCDLNCAVRAACELMRTYVQTQLEISFNPEEEEIPVYVNTTEIEQVIINLMQNATEAVSGGLASIKIDTSNKGGHVELNIQDNGPGVANEIMDKIFDPFFSTRNNRGGTGLGLSVAHGIITDHGGRLSVSNLPGGGAKFTVILPCWHEAICDNITQPDRGVDI